MAKPYVKFKKRGSRVARADALMKKLAKLDAALQAPIAEAVQAGAHRIAETARSLAPVDTGTLRSAIKVRKARKGLQARIGITGKRDRDRAYYGHFVEFGTRGGKVAVYREVKGRPFTAVNTKRTRYGSNRPYFEMDVPARPAQPFLRPAMDAEGPAAVEEVRRAVRKTLAAGVKGVLPAGGVTSGGGDDGGE